MWILLRVLPHKLQSITLPETNLSSHYLCSAWFPLHSLFRYLRFNLEDLLWSFSICFSIITASQISQDLCWRPCLWRMNLLNLWTFSKPVILHLNASEHMPHPDWCEVRFHYQVYSCPPIGPTPGLLLSFIIIAMKVELTLSCLFIPTLSISHSCILFSTLRIKAENWDG